MCITYLKVYGCGYMMASDCGVWGKCVWSVCGQYYCICDVMLSVDVCVHVW